MRTQNKFLLCFLFFLGEFFLNNAFAQSKSSFSPAYEKALDLACKLQFKFTGKLELAAMDKLTPMVSIARGKDKASTEKALKAWAPAEARKRLKRVSLLDENFYNKILFNLNNSINRCDAPTSLAPFDRVATLLLRATTLSWSSEYLDQLKEPRIYTLYLFSPKLSNASMKTYFQEVNALKGYETTLTYRGNEYRKDASHEMKFDVFGVLLKGTTTHQPAKIVFGNHVWEFYSEKENQLLTLEFYANGKPKFGFLGKAVIMPFHFRRQEIISIHERVDFYSNGLVKLGRVAEGPVSVFDRNGDEITLKKGDCFSQNEKDGRYLQKVMCLR